MDLDKTPRTSVVRQNTKFSSFSHRNQEVGEHKGTERVLQDKRDMLGVEIQFNFICLFVVPICTIKMDKL